MSTYASTLATGPIINFFIVVQVQLSPFLPHHGFLPHPSPPLPLEPTPFGFVHVSLIHVP